VIDFDVFQRVKRVMDLSGGRVTKGDVLAALTEELGEYSRAVRVEDSAPICHNKRADEPSKVEIVDLMLVAVEAYLLRGGTFHELGGIADRKLSKWERLWDDVLGDGPPRPAG
jgi:hypothetical protein